jgi:hypothetical protein
MNASRPWHVFALCSLGWLLLSVYIAPVMSGGDVFIFRDAGWNLAAEGSFESAALPYMHDLTPRLYSHYTPLMPLLFAGYASVFPRDAYSGTIFNLLVGILAAGVSLRWVLRPSSDIGQLRFIVALTVAVFPVAFVVFDRPEALGLVLATVTIASAAKVPPNLCLVGFLLAVTFLAHPFAAIFALLWSSTSCFLHNTDQPTRGLETLRQIAIIGVSALAILLPVLLIYYVLDPTSLARFAIHAFGKKTGFGVVIASSSSQEFLQTLRRHITGEGILPTSIRLPAFLSSLGLIVWALNCRKDLRYADWLLISISIGGTCASVIAFPNQAYYLGLLTFMTPLALTIIAPSSGALVVPALAMLLFAVAANLPFVCLGVMNRIEQGPSFEAARQQPSYLAAQLPSPDAVVGINGDSYDLFKPVLRHLVTLREKGVDYADLSAIVNCYDMYKGDSGVVRPLPEKVNPKEFRMIQPAPEHLWISILGRRIRQAEWGYGCDLYLRIKQ